MVNDKSEVFMLFSHYKLRDADALTEILVGERRTRDGFKLFKIEEDDLHEYKIDLDRRMSLTNAAITITEPWNESVVLIGLYASEGEVKGSCFISYDVEGGAVVKTHDLGKGLYMKPELFVGEYPESTHNHNMHYVYNLLKIAYNTDGRFCVLIKDYKNSHITIAPLLLLLFFDQDGELISKQELYTQRHRLFLKEDGLIVLSQGWDKAKGKAASLLEKNRELKLSNFSWGGELKSEDYLMRLKHKKNGLFSFRNTRKDKNGDLVFLSHKPFKFYFGKIKF